MTHLPLSDVNHLRAEPVTRAEADSFIAEHHRHYGPTLQSIFRVGCSVNGNIVGVAVVGRPSARHLDDGYTLEVLRCCTVGYPNACSFLYGAAWRAGRALGYRRMVTYALASEPGTSLRAAGWRVTHETKAESWNRANRPRVDVAPLQKKLRWEAIP